MRTFRTSDVNYIFVSIVAVLLIILGFHVNKHMTRYIDSKVDQIKVENLMKLKFSEGDLYSLLEIHTAFKKLKKEDKKALKELLNGKEIKLKGYISNIDRKKDGIKGIYISDKILVKGFKEKGVYVELMNENLSTLSEKMNEKERYITVKGIISIKENTSNFNKFFKVINANIVDDIRVRTPVTLVVG